jgi:hypothetical protein
MPADPISAGRKGGQSRSAAKLAAARRNGFQKVTVEHETILSRNQAQEIAQKIGKPLEELYERVPAQKVTQKSTTKPVLLAATEGE